MTAMFNSVAEQVPQDNPFDDGVLCDSPTPLATSTAKKKLNTLACTSYTQAAVVNNERTDSVFKHPGVFLPGGTSVQQTTGKRQSEACQQQKSSRSVENFPPRTPNAVTKLDTSVMSEQSLVSNASSMGLLPDDLLNSEPEEMLVPQETYSVTKSLEQSHSSDTSDIEQARRYPAEESYSKSRMLSGSHFASAHAFLQLQGMKTGIDANLSQPKIILGEEDICKLDKDFGSEREDTIVLDGPMAESPLNTPVSTPPVKMALNDVVTNATKLIDAQGNKHLEELSYCSSLGLSHDDNQSFSLEKMLRGNKPEEKPWTEELSQTSEYGIGWGKSQTFSCEPFADDRPVESTKLYEDNPFDNDLAYRTEFDANFSTIQNDGLSGEFVPFELAAAKLDADEAEFFGQNANPDFDDVLQVPLAEDVEDWSYRSHISFTTPTNHERMSLGTYMHTRSESIKNQSLFNMSHAATELPPLEELEEEEDDDDGPEDLKPGNKDDQPAENSPPPVLTQSLISNSLISNILDMASMSMSNDEIACKFVAQLDKRQRSRSGTKRDISSLKSNMQTPMTFKPDASQSIVSQDNFQSRVPRDISTSSSSSMVNNGSIMSASCSTQTLTDQKSGIVEELESSVQMSAQNQSYRSPVAAKNNRSSSPDGVKFRTPRESLYVPRALDKRRNIPDESKFNCHLRFDDADATKPVIKEGPNRKSTTVSRPQTKTEEVVSHGLQKMPRDSLKSAEDSTRLSAASQSCGNHRNGKDRKELGTETKSLADLSAVLSARMNITDARKIQAILMNRHHEGNEVDMTCQWQTMMEDPLGQTQVNFNVFTSSLLEDENPAADVESCLDSAGFATLKRKPKFEIDRVVNIPDCTIGISEKACVTVRNLVDCWLECHLDMLHLFVNGREVNIRTYNPFRMKQKLVLGPKETQILEVVFFPKDPGSYMAEVRMSSGSQTDGSHQKTHEDDHVTCYMKLNSYADLPSIHFSPKELDFGQQSWGSTGCLPITVANKNKAKIPLRFVILSKSSNIFRWGHKMLPDVPGYESNYTVVSDNIACLTLPGAQAGCALNMTSLDIICDLVKKCALKDPKQATSLIGVVEIQLDVPSAQPPLGIIQLVVTAGIAKLHVSNGVDLIVMETSVNKPANRTVTLRNAGTLDLHVALDISRHEQVFTLDSGYLKIPVGERADVDIAFHPPDETVKSYNAEMLMFMEPNGPVFGIPVQGKVQAASHSHSRQHKWLLADQSHINFGGVPLGQSKEVSLQLKNNSSSTAKIELVMRSEGGAHKFLSLLNACVRLSDSKSVVIQPNEVYSVAIAFSPTRCSVFNGKINIKSSDDSTRFVIPLTGYGGLSEVFLAEPRSGILKITRADATAASSQTANFTLRNSGIRDAFFCVQIYEDSDKSVLAKKQAFAIDPPNGILKSLEKITVTLLCNQMAMPSLPVHVAIYHGEEEARQQLKRALNKFPNQRSKWKWSDWFDTMFTNEDYTQSCDQTVSQRSDINVFFDHLSTLELTVEISKKTHNEKWSCKNPKADWNSSVRESQVAQRPTAKPLKDMVKKDSKLQKHFPNIETDKENVQSGRVGSGSQMSVADKTGGIYSLPGEGVPSNPQKIWRLVPEELTFISKDPQIFSIINFGQESLNFQLSWATDRMSVSNSVLTINPHSVSEISVSPCHTSDPWEGFIYVAAKSLLQKVIISYKGHPDSSNRQPLQSKSDYNNRFQIPTNLTSPEMGSVDLGPYQNLESKQPVHSLQSIPKPQSHSSAYNKLLLTNLPQPSISAVHVPERDSIELSAVKPAKEQTTLASAPEAPLFGLVEEEEKEEQIVDVQMASEIIQFYVESGSDLVSNYLEFTNFGKTSLNWALNNQTSFPYFSSNDGKRTVMKSYDIFKIFEREGTLSAGQTQRVHVLFYPEMLFDKKFVCYHACELICQCTNASSHQQPTVIPFLLQGFLTNDRCSLASLMSDTQGSRSSMTSSLASSTEPNETASSACCSRDQKIILQPDVLTFQPCPLGKMQQIKVKLKNRNDEPVKITVDGLPEDDVFSVSVKSFMINGKKMVKLPIAFKPILKGFANRQILFSSGTDSLKLQLFGVGV